MLLESHDPNIGSLNDDHNEYCLSCRLKPPFGPRVRPKNASDSLRGCLQRILAFL
jgi:hypothetical protein